MDEITQATAQTEHKRRFLHKAKASTVRKRGQQHGSRHKGIYRTIRETGKHKEQRRGKVFLKTGFTDVTSKVNLKTTAGMQVGDVLLDEGKHTALYIGNGQLVHASINEKGKATGGATGDQTGKEICIRSYYNHPWGCVLRLADST